MSHRALRVDSLLQREIGAILSRDVELPLDCLITVMRVEVTADLKHAKIFVSVLPEHKTGPAFKILQQHIKEVQGILNKRLFMKFVPLISWELDETCRKYAAIDEAIRKQQHSREKD